MLQKHFHSTSTTADRSALNCLAIRDRFPLSDVSVSGQQRKRFHLWPMLHWIISALHASVHQNSFPFQFSTFVSILQLPWNGIFNTSLDLSVFTGQLYNYIQNKASKCMVWILTKAYQRLLQCILFRNKSILANIYKNKQLINTFHYTKFTK